MALKDPGTVPGVECRLTGVAHINSWLDDIEWWRAHLDAGDGDLEQIIAEAPVGDDDRRVLRRDVRALGPLVRGQLFAALLGAVRDGSSLEIDWDTGETPALAVTVTNGHVAIVVTLPC